MTNNEMSISDFSDNHFRAISSEMLSERNIERKTAISLRQMRSFVCFDVLKAYEDGKLSSVSDVTDLIRQRVMHYNMALGGRSFNRIADVFSNVLKSSFINGDGKKDREGD